MIALSVCPWSCVVSDRWWRQKLRHHTEEARVLHIAVVLSSRLRQMRCLLSAPDHATYPIIKRLWSRRFCIVGPGVADSSPALVQRILISLDPYTFSITVLLNHVYLICYSLLYDVKLWCHICAGYFRKYQHRRVPVDAESGQDHNSGSGQ